MKNKKLKFIGISTFLIVAASIILIFSLGVIDYRATTKDYRQTDRLKPYVTDPDCEWFQLDNISGSFMSDSESILILLNNDLLKDQNKKVKHVFVRVLSKGNNCNLIHVQVVLQEGELYDVAYAGQPLKYLDYEVLSGAIKSKHLSKLYIDLSDLKCSSLIELDNTEAIGEVKAWLGKGPNVYFNKFIGGAKHYVIGGSAPDYIVTGSKKDVVQSGGMADCIIHYGGNDIINGGSHNIDFSFGFGKPSVKDVEYKNVE